MLKHVSCFCLRAVKAGRCAVAVRPTDLPEPITAESVRGASAAWTTTAPGQNTSALL